MGNWYSKSNAASNEDVVTNNGIRRSYTIPEVLEPIDQSSTSAKHLAKISKSKTAEDIHQPKPSQNNAKSLSVNHTPVRQSASAGGITQIQGNSQQSNLTLAHNKANNHVDPKRTTSAKASEKPGTKSPVRPVAFPTHAASSASTANNALSPSAKLHRPMTIQPHVHDQPNLEVASQSTASNTPTRNALRITGHGLSSVEILLIRKAWATVRQRGRSEPGATVLKQVFQHNAEIRKFFGGMQISPELNSATVNPVMTLRSTGDSPGSSNNSGSKSPGSPKSPEMPPDVSILNPQFRFNKHAERFTAELDTIMENLDSTDVLEHQLIELGKRHHTIMAIRVRAASTGSIKGTYWDVFARCLAQNCLGSGGTFHQTRNSKTTEAWVKASLYIVNTMKAGYKLRSREIYQQQRMAEQKLKRHVHVDPNTEQY